MKILLKQNYPNQFIQFIANNQSITLQIYLKGSEFYASLFNDDKLIINSVPILDRIPINKYTFENNINGYIFAICDNPEKKITIENIGISSNIFYETISKI